MNRIRWAKDGSCFEHYQGEQLIATVPAASLAGYRAAGHDVPDAPIAPGESDHGQKTQVEVPPKPAAKAPKRTQKRAVQKAQVRKKR